MQDKKVVSSRKSNSNYLEFNFFHNGLIIIFNGIMMTIDSLILISEPGFVNAVKQYLDHSSFSDLKVNDGFDNKLEFDNLVFHLIVDGDNNASVYVSLKEIPDSEGYFNREIIYTSTKYDLILWAIANAGPDFNIEKTRLEILSENQKRNLEKD
ncbi:MAG: hypothetical protein WCO35_03920 [Candidatus Nomurabacteria bacterium]